MKIGDRQVAIVEASGEHGSGKRGPSLGASAVRLFGRAKGNLLVDNLPFFKAKNFNNEYNNCNFPTAKNLDKILKSAKSTNDVLQEVMGKNYFPIIISGDHSNAVGVVSGVSNFINNEDLGVIWVDAHSDLHTPYTSPSGNVHGMPLAALMGLDNLDNAQGEKPCNEVVKMWDRFKKIGGEAIKVKPENIVFISIRSFEQPERELVNKYKIKHFTPYDILNKGIEIVLQETKDYLSHLNHHYISFDVDSMDPSVSEGTGTPVPNGLSLLEAFKVFAFAKEYKSLKALEITEINPLLDYKNKMAKAVFKLIDSLI